MNEYRAQLYRLVKALGGDAMVLGIVHSAGDEISYEDAAKELKELLDRADHDKALRQGGMGIV